MNKSELVSSVAEGAEISKADAAKAVDAIVAGISGALSKGEQVTIIGFGTFSIRERAARQGRNPQTGKPMQIAASKSVGFKAGKQLKDAVQ
jgi:DNA-binding protein HU-beta